MYSLLAFLMFIVIFLGLKACIFSYENSKWPKNARELIDWKMKRLSRVLVFTLASYPLWFALTKPLANLGKTGIAMLLVLMIPVGIFFISYFRNGK